jgi:hypothetical protein
VDKNGENGCWNWTGWGLPTGYGRFDLRKHKPLCTHVALTLAGRPRPEHPRDNALHGDFCTPRCVNPDHLRWGTKAENTEDRDRLGRRIAKKGTEHWAARFTEDQIRAIRADTRSQRKIAAAYGTEQGTISAIKRRKIWKHVI